MAFWLGDATRRDILARVLREEQSVSALARRYDMSFAAVQKHVAVLERAGLIVKRARGRERVVNAELAMIQRASQLLRAYEHFDQERATDSPDSDDVWRMSVLEIPQPDDVTPSTRGDLTNVRFLKSDVNSPLIEAGDYTYYDDEGAGGRFEEVNVKYLYGPQRLIIGRFTALGPGVTFLMPGGNHPMVGPSTYPFTMFGGTWGDNTLETFMAIEQPADTVVGNDVWIGREATIMPGISIGDGAIIGAHSVVTRNVEPYAVVAGNPARRIRVRFAPEGVQRLMSSRWWDWPIELITEHAATIMAGTPAELTAIDDERRMNT